MRKALLGTLFVATLLVANATLAQDQNNEAGPVWRMVYYRIKLGQEAACWKDFHENGKPIFELWKKEGIVTDYKIFQNPLRDHPGDWDIALALAHPNYAALDQEAKVGAAYLKHYGSPEAAAAAAKKRGELREVIATRLVREVLLK